MYTDRPGVPCDLSGPSFIEAMKLKHFSILSALFCAFFATAGVQRVNAAPAPPAVSQVVPGAKRAVTTTQAQSYAQREKAASQELRKFAGGNVYIAISGVGALVLVILLVALLV
jgi:hypothetical protein